MTRSTSLFVLLGLLLVLGVWSLNWNTAELVKRRDLLSPQEKITLTSENGDERIVYLEPGMSLQEVRRAAQQGGQTCQTCWAHAGGTVTVFTVQQQGESAQDKEERHEARVEALQLDYPKTGECP